MLNTNTASNPEGQTPKIDKPVYLLVPKPPQIPCTADFPGQMKDWNTNFPSYWSFDVEPMGDAEREHLNLPRALLQVTAAHKNHWKNEVYDAAAGYQKVKGYSYEAFAESLELPVLEVINGLALEPSFTVVEGSHIVGA
ncbi:hypothetical protein VNI00_012978 [Paramarasmius palmivorus]|uniref:Uncharacterized protein n=1 Tax=Paramarasmius palmivorus TaxID=297713 RepID=A0AAW0BZX8_9AGAR